MHYTATHKVDKNWGVSSIWGTQKKVCIVYQGRFALAVPVSGTMNE